MAITTTREQRRAESRERALAAYMEHHEAVLALLERIGRDRRPPRAGRRSRASGLGPRPIAAHWRKALQEIADQMFGEGEYAE